MSASGVGGGIPAQRQSPSSNCSGSSGVGSLTGLSTFCFCRSLRMSPRIAVPFLAFRLYQFPFTNTTGLVLFAS